MVELTSCTNPMGLQQDRGGQEMAENGSIVQLSAMPLKKSMKGMRIDMRAKESNAVSQEVLVETMCKKFGEAPDDRTGHGTGIVPREELPRIGPEDQKALPENMGSSSMPSDHGTNPQHGQHQHRIASKWPDAMRR
jgi:hypothetical protein